MAWWCYCIHLRIYGLVLAVFQFSICLLAYFILDAYDAPSSVMWINMQLSLVLMVAAGFLLVGSFHRHHFYIFIYLSLLVFCIFVLFIAMCVQLFRSTGTAAIFFGEFLVTSLLSHPINFLYVEMREERRQRSAV